MRVLVAGGTGFIGSYLCPELAGRGHDVVALARDPSDAAFDGTDVETMTGDVTDPASLREPMAGADAVVNLVALSPLFRPKGGERRHYDVHLGGTENLVRAAEEAGVDRILQQSALGADPDGDTAYIRAKGRAEAVVRDSDLAWTVTRPSIVFGDGGEFVPFTRKLATPYVTPLPGGGRTRFQPIWVADLIPMLADVVEGSVSGDAPPSSGESQGEGATRDETGGERDSGETPHTGENPHAGRVYTLAGPEKLTLAEVARLAHAAKGRPVNVVPVPMALAGVGLRLLGAVPGAPMGTDQYRSLSFDNTTDDNDVARFGVGPSSLRTLADYLGVADRTPGSRR